MDSELSQGRRRLAAIMFTDMVGYTALGQRNEALSLALVEKHRKLVRPVFRRHGGREVKTIGDAFLAEFPNAVDSVRCAYDIQRVIREFNLAVPQDKRIHLRIGLHLGEVVESRGDTSGDAVNVASRIEALAEDGGICLTRQVHDHVQSKVDLQLSSIGPRSLKNVNAPVDVYKVVMPWSEGTEPSAIPDKKRIAVLPFTNLSPSPSDEYFADGMTEELISTMSKIGNLSVISRTSVMKYKKESKSVTEIARELSVGTILEGSVRLAGNKIRVTIQMIDPAMDKHLWAESFDRELQDVFEVQSDIAHRIASTLSVQLLSTEKDDIERPPTENTEVYQLYLKGRYHVNKGWAENRKDSERARRYFEEALKLDPGFALAHAGISDYYHAAAHANWYAPEEAYPLMRDHAMKAIDLDPRLAEGHAALAAEYMHYEWMWEEAEKEFKKAIALKPSYDNAYAIYSYLLAVTGRFDGEYEMLKRADELDPFGAVRRLLVPALMHVGKGEEAMEIAKSVVEELPESLNAHEALGWMLHRASREDEALLEFRKAVSLSNEDSAARADLAFILALTGRKEEAGAILEQLRELSRTTYISDVKLACILYVLGKHDDAFKSLEIAYGRRAIDLPELRLMPELRELCEDSRWISIENRMGLPHLGPLPEGRQDIHPGPPAGEVGPQRQDPQ